MLDNKGSRAKGTSSKHLPSKPTLVVYPDILSLHVLSAETSGVEVVQIPGSSCLLDVSRSLKTSEYAHV